MAVSERALLMTRARSVHTFAALVGSLVAGCSGQVAGVAFETVDYEVVGCPLGTPEGSDCLTVTAPVVGDGTGTGRCVVYARSLDENLALVAESGDLEIEAGEVTTWNVIVPRPEDQNFHGWNPVCTPMIEG